MLPLLEGLEEAQGQIDAPLRGAKHWQQVRYIQRENGGQNAENVTVRAKAHPHVHQRFPRSKERIEVIADGRSVDEEGELEGRDVPQAQ